MKFKINNVIYNIICDRNCEECSFCENFKINSLELIWEHSDFESHPDLKCLNLNSSFFPLVYIEYIFNNWESKVIERNEYVLPIGSYVFPGEEYITIIK
jgi:hypothetical protein